MRIGVDVDGVLAQWEPNVRRIIKEEFGIDVPVSTEWDTIKKSVERDQWNWLWSEDGGLYDMFDPSVDPYPGVFEGVRRLRELGDVVIITGVPRAVVPDRLWWLMNNIGAFDEFRVVNGMGDKSKVLPLCDVYIDDSVQVVEDILENTDAIMILWRRPWNEHTEIKSHKPYYIVDNWEQITSLIKQLTRI